jgi:hypothetical protein
MSICGSAFTSPNWSSLSLKSQWFPTPLNIKFRCFRSLRYTWPPWTNGKWTQHKSRMSPKYENMCRYKFNNKRFRTFMPVTFRVGTQWTMRRLSTIDCKRLFLSKNAQSEDRPFTFMIIWKKERRSLNFESASASGHPHVRDSCFLIYCINIAAKHQNDAY